MGQSPEELKGDIARTRNDLSGTLDAIEDRISPSRVMERQKQQVRSRWTGMKESVMGSAQDWRDSAGERTGQLSDRVSDMSDRVSDAPEMARQRTQGNPFAAGVIAFGAGLLAAAIFPGTQTEGQLAQTLQDKASPLVDQAKQAGQEMVSHLKEPAQQAAQQVKDTAAAGAGQVKDTAYQAAQDSKQTASEGVSQVSDQARQSGQALRDQS